MRSAKLIAAASLCTALLLGCGSDDDGGETSTTRTGPKVTGKPIGPPKPRESIQEAVSRIKKTLASGDCAEINQLTTLSRPYDACEGLKARAELPISGAADYGDGGGVIAWGKGAELRNAILIVDSDGLYHLPFIDPYNTKDSIGTEFASEFDSAAEEALAAFRDNDCDAFKKVTVSRYGPGATPDEVCTFLERTAFTALLDSYPEAEPTRLGGNGDYAFYSVSTPEAHYTMVMARQPETDVAPNAPALPTDAPEYGFVDAYQTNPTKAPRSSG